MLKKWAIVLFIVASLIVGCALEYRFVNGTFEDMTLHFEHVQTMLEENQSHVDTQEILNYLDDLHDDFHEKEKVLKALIWHTGLKDVEIGISKIAAYAKNNNFDEAIAETKSLVDYCRHYGQDFKLSWENIF